MSDPADRAARERVRTELDGPMVVEASAGTGKTTVLLDRALAYVEGGARRLSEIAIVTFTELAAAELRERLRGSILERLAKSAGGVVRDRWRQALSDLEVASVGTIHSFCVDLLRSRPVEAGLDPDFGIADEMAKEMLVDEAWEEQLYDLEPGEAGFEAALDLGLERPADLRRVAGQLLPFRASELPVAAGERPDVHGQVRRALTLLEQAESRALRGGSLHGQLVDAIERCRELLALGEREAARELVRGGPPAPRYGKANEAAAKALRDEAKEILNQTQTAIFEWLWRSAAHWLAGVRQRYERLAGERSLLDFDRQIGEAVELLREHPEVRAALGRRFPVVLIDEFQDTDRDQIELATLLAESSGPANGPRSLFVVGDPKQSIYRFRAADLENYRRFVDRVPASSWVRLTQSFRSAPALADWINAEMGRVMARPLGGPAYEVDYSPLVAAEAAAPPPAAASGVVQLRIDVPPDVKVDPARELEADALARMARALVAGQRGWVRDRDGVYRAARWGDLALLLPRFTILEPYEEALRRHQVPYRTEAGRAYYRRDEVHALSIVLRALADPGDAVAVAGALRGPGFGCSDHELMAYSLAQPRPRFDLAESPAPASSPDPAAAGRVAEALARLRALHAETRGLPLPELAQAVIDRLGLAAFYRLLWRGEQRVANLDKAVEQARRFEELGRPSLQGYVRWLAARGESDFDEGDAPAIERSEEAVRVLTVHKAKGLEFPVVLLGGLVGNPQGGPSERLRTARDRSGDEPGRLEARLGKTETPGFAAAQASEDERWAAERKRLLYVAVTRARDLLVLPWLPGYRKVTDLFKLLYSKDGAEFEGSPLAARWHESELPAGEAPEGDAPILDAVLQGPVAPSPARALAAPALAEPLPPAARGAIARAERRGRAAHALLDAALAGKAEPDLQGFDDAQRLAARETARRFLASPLGRRAVAAPIRLLETPLTRLAAAGAVEDLRLDLAFRDNGSWVLVDYKNDREGARSGARRAAELRAQLAAYADALEALTGVPVGEAHIAFLATGETRTFRRAELASPTEQLDPV